MQASLFIFIGAQVTDLQLISMTCASDDQRQLLSRGDSMNFYPR